MKATHNTIMTKSKMMMGPPKETCRIQSSITEPQTTALQDI